MGSFIYAIENWTQIWDSLYSKNVLAYRQPAASRLQLAIVLNKDIQRIFSGEIKINHQQKKQLDKLIDEFRDELFLIEQKDKMYSVSRKISNISVTNLWSGRFLNELEQYFNHPDISESVRFSNILYFGCLPLSSNFQANISMKTNDNFVTADKSLLVDEAYIKLTTPVQVTLGRQYFLLDRLGLLADNYFDAFEAFRLDYSYFNLIYSRLSTTNYPYRSLFVSNDDYWVFRISGIKEKETEIGLTYLASGIASEKGSGIDFHTTIGEKELLGEFALYWASKTDYTAFKDAKIASILGLDLYKTHRTNIFLQLGSVENGFTPMASSLVYSAGNHLYFDQDTLGFDATFTYQPKKEKELTLWEIRIDRTGCFPQLTTWELEFVWLVKQNMTAHSNQYVFRYIQPISKWFSLYLEDIFWVRAHTILYPNRNYNQIKSVVSFNF
ncbi:MAG: hypothetical protein AB1349_08510 [Elusimicrobiota bacterium]